MQDSFHHILMKAHHAVHKCVMSEAKKHGLTSGQPKILEFLAEKDGVDQTTIAAACEIEAATVGNLLGRMESAGLIERRRMDGNRRSLFVYLTAAGRRAAEQTERIFDDVEKTAFAGLSREEVLSLRAMLGRVYANVSAKEAEYDA